MTFLRTRNVSQISLEPLRESLPTSLADTLPCLIDSLIGETPNYLVYILYYERFLYYSYLGRKRILLMMFYYFLFYFNQSRSTLML